MKVKELIEQLNEYDQEAELIIQKDSEGNEYSPLCGADPNCVYVAESTWSGDVYDTKWSHEDAGMEEEEWAALKNDNPKVVVLFPIN